MDNSKIIEDIASLKTTSQAHENRIEKLEDDNDLLHRLTVVTENQNEMIKQQQEQTKKMGETFQSININLTKLNMSQDELRDDVKGVKQRVDSFESDIKDQIKDVEEKADKNSSRGKFDVLGFITNDAMKMLLVAIVTAIISWLGFAN